MKDLLESDWFKTRPEFIKDMIRKKPLAEYVMLKTGSDYYVPYSYCEDGTMTMIRFNNLTREPMWKVFGINPDDLIAVPVVENDAKQYDKGGNYERI